MNVDDIGIGGMKEVQFMITGQGAYSKMKYESGVHRVQRVPETESGGRVHTSTITVAVMPEVDEDGLMEKAAQRACAGCSYRKTCKDARRISQLPGLLLHKSLLSCARSSMLKRSYHYLVCAI